MSYNRGIPHSIQALQDGVEFMLIFDDGSFSETNTFLATEIFAHNPVHSLNSLKPPAYELGD
jgi:hypothetical protein